MPINVDIQGFHWREALETICRKNGLAFTEYRTTSGDRGVPGEMTQGPLGTGRPVPPAR
jgi:hypothetical protein